MTVNAKKVAAGINYLKAMREGNMNAYELAEDLEIDVKIIKEAIQLARENKEESKKGFDMQVSRPRVFIGRGVKGEFQTIKKVEVDIAKTIQLNYDTTQKSEFIVMLPVKVTITRM